VQGSNKTSAEETVSRFGRVLPEWLTLCAALVFLAVAAPAAALDPSKAVTQYIHSAWSSSNGLPQNAALAILQTRDGYLWVGTQEGLARFDGLQFKVFDRSNTPVMTNTTVQALLEDDEGALWAGTEGGGVLRLKNGVWSAFRAASGLPSDIVHALLKDREGTLWAGTYSGVGRFSRDRWTHYATGMGGTSYRVRCLLQDHAGTIWAGTEGGGLYRFTGDRFEPFVLSASLPDPRIRCLAESPKGELCVGMEGSGLAILRDGAWVLFRESAGLPYDRVYSLCWDRDGCLWVGTEGGGLGRYVSGRWSRYTTREGLSGDLVYALYEDREASLWIGVFGGGLDRLREGKWTSYTVAEGLPTNNIWCAYADPKGGVWAGTEEGLSHFSEGKWTTYAAKDGVPHNRVRSILMDRSGTVWVGTGGGGLGRFKDGKWTRFTSRDALSSDRVYAILEDRQGSIWLGTFGGGVLRYAQGRWTQFTAADGLASDRVRCILEDRSGAIWVGTYGGGLSRYSQGKWTTVTEREGLPSNLILALTEDSRGNLWVGTSGGGLGMLRNGRWHRFTLASGLRDDKAFQILEDKRGHLWFSSNKGVCEVDGREMEAFADGKVSSVHCSLHGRSEGLLSQECNGGSQPAGCRTPDGRLWFPTPAGLAVLDPARIPKNNTPPRVAVNEVLVNRRPLGPEAPPSVPVGKGELEIRYSGISLVAPEKIQFRYMLEPYETSWVEAGARREAFYTNLPPGAYRFRLMASNEDGVFSTPAVLFSIRLTPPFWRTPLFYLLAVLLAAILGAGLFLLSVGNIRRQAARLSRLVEERTCQLAEANERLELLSVVDSLTGVHNRRKLDEFLDQEWKRGIRSGRPLSLLIVDADRFKSFNDDYGHQAGDAVLRAVAGVLKANLKRPSDLVARFGGDEFVVVMEGTDSEGALMMAETLRSRIESQCRASCEAGIPRDVTVSIGVSTALPTIEGRFEDLLRSADEALLQAKREGRNLVRCVFLSLKSAPGD
jgi:diguanylate cyclase (GGDEF)-like protein